jgi:putative transposase
VVAGVLACISPSFLTPIPRLGTPKVFASKRTASIETKDCGDKSFLLRGLPVINNRPKRLGLIYSAEPLYFVTFCTRDRRPLSSLTQAQIALENYARKGLNEFNIAVGRYVVTPDHIHLFVRGGPNFSLSNWVAGLKRAIAIALEIRGKIWQPTFFDHILRSDESYAEKWNYVGQNPVRARLVARAEEWPYQGEVALIDRA